MPAPSLGDVKPDVIEIGFGPWRYTVRHLSGQFCNQAGAPALSHLGGKLPHGFRRDQAAFAAGKSSAGIVEGRQKCHATAFAFFPQGKRFLYGFFLAVQPPGFNGTAGNPSHRSSLPPNWLKAIGKHLRPLLPSAKPRANLVPGEEMSTPPHGSPHSPQGVLSGTPSFFDNFTPPQGKPTPMRSHATGCNTI
jgi:hypothetical protein